MEAYLRTTYLISLVVAGVFFFLTDVCAQSLERPAWRLGGTAGGGSTWDDEGSIGSGWLAGAYVGRRLSEHVDVEFAADLLRHERNTGRFGFQAEGHTTYVSAVLVRRFGPPAANVFLLGGGTLGIHRGNAGLADTPALNENHSTNVGFIFGGGFSVRLRHNVEIAPLVRWTLMRISDDADPWSSIMAGVRIGR
jgi:hypothetical protein